MAKSLQWEEAGNKSPLDSDNEEEEKKTTDSDSAEPGGHQVGVIFLECTTRKVPRNFT